MTFLQVANTVKPTLAASIESRRLAYVINYGLKLQLTFVFNEGLE